MGRRRRILLVCGGIAAAFLAYEAVTTFVAYTDDAYVRTDLVALAPQVTGRIVAVHVRDNEAVKKGDPLLTIDPVPFRLVIAQKQAEIDEAKAQAAADEQAIAVAQDKYNSAASAATFAQTTQRRLATLSATGYLARENLDRANDELRRAQDAVSGAEASIAEARSVELMHRASLARAKAEMATAQWQLARTEIPSPTDGIVNNLTVPVGDTANVDVPLIGILDAHAWRILANYKQSYLRDLKLGDRVWVWLDSYPWHLLRAHIASVGQGISRDPEAVKLLPYVAPTTDWIRLQRRFPVTILLDGPPPQMKLYMGADARTLIFP